MNKLNGKDEIKCLVLKISEWLTMFFIVIVLLIFAVFDNKSRAAEWIPGLGPVPDTDPVKWLGYWHGGETKNNILDVPITFNSDGCKESTKVAIRHALEWLVRETYLYFETPFISFTGTQSGLRVEADPILNSDGNLAFVFSGNYNGVHCLLPAQMFRLTGSASTPGFVRLGTGKDDQGNTTIRGFSIVVNVDIPDCLVHGVLAMEVIHGRTGMAHASVRESMMNVGLSLDCQTKQWQEQLQPYDLSGLNDKYELPEWTNKLSLGDDGSFNIPRFRFPPGEKDDEKIICVSTRWESKRITGSIAQTIDWLEPGDFIQILRESDLIAADLCK